MKIVGRAPVAGDPLVRVLGITELLERILSHLDMLDLLHAQTVSKYFHRTIANSPTLQRLLFFKPHPGCKPRQNPLLAKTFPTLLTLKQPHCWCNLHLPFVPLCRTWATDPDRRDRVLRPDASWRRMLLVQPPTKLDTIIAVSADTCTRSTYVACRASLGPRHQHHQADGLRMGLLFDLVVKLDGMHPYPRFYVWWHMFPLAERGREDWEIDEPKDESKDPSDCADNVYCESFVGGTGELALQPLWMVNNPLRDRVTLFHTHETTCCHIHGYSDGLRVESEFLTDVDTEPKALLDYHQEPSTWGTLWSEYGTMKETKDGGKGRCD